MGGRHTDGHSFNLVIDKPYHYGGAKMRTTVLTELAQHFKGHSIDLMVWLEFWEILESAELYALVKAEAVGTTLGKRRGPKKLESPPVIPLGAIDNLRDLISRCKWLEENEPVLPITATKA